MREIRGKPDGTTEEAPFVQYHNWEAVGYAQPRTGIRVTLPVLTMVVDTQGMKLFDFFQAVSNQAESGQAPVVEFIRDWREDKKHTAVWWRFKEPPKLT